MEGKGMEGNGIDENGREGKGRERMGREAGVMVCRYCRKQAPCTSYPVIIGSIRLLITCYHFRCHPGEEKSALHWLDNELSYLFTLPLLRHTLFLKSKQFAQLSELIMWSEFPCPANQHPKNTIKKKSPHTSWISQYVCPPIVWKSCYFDCRINKPFAFSPCTICVSCSVLCILMSTHAGFFV